jgi:flagellar biosynthesis/type III secretory pathway protein FliH
MDVASAEKTESFWMPVSSSIKNVEIVCDEAIEKGGCLLESENGSSVDMRVQTVLKHLEEGIKRIY